MKRKGVKSLGKERSARGEEPLFKAVCSSRIFFNEDFVLRTTSVSPLDRDKDTVLDPRKMLAHFSAIKISAPLFDVTSTSRSLCDLCKGAKSLGKKGSARGKEPLFKVVFSSRITFIGK